MSVFSDNLRQYRDKANLSRQELADSVKISLSTLGMYEQGRREPSIDKLKDIAAALHVSIDDLLGYHLDEFDKYKAIFASFAAMHKEEYDVIEDIPNMELHQGTVDDPETTIIIDEDAHSFSWVDFANKRDFCSFMADTIRKYKQKNLSNFARYLFAQLREKQFRDYEEEQKAKRIQEQQDQHILFAGVGEIASALSKMQKEKDSEITEEAVAKILQRVFDGSETSDKERQETKGLKEVASKAARKKKAHK